METTYAFYPGPFGYWKIGYRDGMVTWLQTVATPDAPDTPDSLTDRVCAQLQEYLRGARRTFDVPVDPAGTPFQQRVWRALLELPYGETRTYGEIARAIGCPAGSRAVGAANGKNPIWILIPCHRVIGADGTLTGYAGGLAMKQRLLELEQEQEGRAR